MVFIFVVGFFLGWFLLSAQSFTKIPLAWQDRNRHPNRLIPVLQTQSASSRCACAIQIVRRFESAVETQPQLHPAFLRLPAIASQYFITARFAFI
jgi:hypothetical protein